MLAFEILDNRFFLFVERYAIFDIRIMVFIYIWRQAGKHVNNQSSKIRRHNECDVNQIDGGVQYVRPPIAGTGRHTVRFSIYIYRKEHTKVNPVLFGFAETGKL